jgi:hypothetical protein
MRIIFEKTDVCAACGADQDCSKCGIMSAVEITDAEWDAIEQAYTIHCLKTFMLCPFSEYLKALIECKRS